MNSGDTLSPVISNVVSIQPDEFETIETVTDDVKEDFTTEGQDRSPKKKVFYMSLGSQSVSCSYCPFKSSDPADMQNHVQDSHICDVCNWVFTKKVGLDNHKKSHIRASQALVAPVSCKYCELKFVSNKLLIRHILKTHETQQIKFHNEVLPQQKEKVLLPFAKNFITLGTEKAWTASKDLSKTPVKQVPDSRILKEGFYHPSIRKYPFHQSKLRKSQTLPSNSSDNPTIKLVESKMRTHSLSVGGFAKQNKALTPRHGEGFKSYRKPKAKYFVIKTKGKIKKVLKVSSPSISLPNCVKTIERNNQKMQIEDEQRSESMESDDFDITANLDNLLKSIEAEEKLNPTEEKHEYEDFYSKKEVELVNSAPETKENDSEPRALHQTTRNEESIDSRNEYDEKISTRSDMNEECCHKEEMLKRKRTSGCRESPRKKKCDKNQPLGPEKVNMDPSNSSHDTESKILSSFESLTNQSKIIREEEPPVLEREAKINETDNEGVLKKGSIDQKPFLNSDMNDEHNQKGNLLESNMLIESGYKNNSKKEEIQLEKEDGEIMINAKEMETKEHIPKNVIELSPDFLDEGDFQKEVKLKKNKNVRTKRITLSKIIDNHLLKQENKLEIGKNPNMKGNDFNNPKREIMQKKPQKDNFEINLSGTVVSREASKSKISYEIKAVKKELSFVNPETKKHVTKDFSAMYPYSHFEGNFLQHPKDEILPEMLKPDGNDKTMVIMHNSKVVCKLKPTNDFSNKQAFKIHNPFQKDRNENLNLSEKYQKFWTDLGLQPKIKISNLDRAWNIRHSEKKHKIQPKHLSDKRNKQTKIRKFDTKKTIKKFAETPVVKKENVTKLRQSKDPAHNKLPNCLICKASFDNFRKLLGHITMKHFKPHVNKLITQKYPGFWVAERANDGKEHICHDCGQRMTNRGQIQRHLGVDHNMLWDLYIDKVQEIKDRQKPDVDPQIQDNINYKTQKEPLRKKIKGPDISKKSENKIKPKKKKKIKQVMENELENEFKEVKKRLKSKDDTDCEKPQEEVLRTPPKIEHYEKNFVGQDKRKSKSPKGKDNPSPSCVDTKLSSIPDLNPYSRKLQCHRKLKDCNPPPVLTASATIFQDIEINVASSLKEPYCSICQILLEPSVRGMLSTTLTKSSEKVPLQSAVWIPTQTPDTKVPTPSQGFPISLLLVCRRCKLCVHSACYGQGQKTREDWMCDRCNQDMTTNTLATCTLCLQGGKDLRKTTSDSFAHVTCSLLIPEASLSSCGLLELGQVPSKRQNLVCLVCGEEGDRPAVHCQASKECKVTFHPSCAIRDKVDIVLGPNGKLIMRCCFCVEKFNLAKKEVVITKYHPQDIEVGEKVQFRNNVGDDELGIVKEVASEKYFSIAFDDGTFSDNVDPEDVTFEDEEDISENCPVSVPWEGVLYSGVFKGSNTLFWYKLQPEKGGKLVEFDRTMITKISER